MTLKQKKLLSITKKLIKQISNTKKIPKLLFSEVWFYDYANNELGIVYHDEELSELEFSTLTAIFQTMTNSNLSLFTYSLLHELGHFYSHCVKSISIKTIKQEITDALVIDKLYGNNLISFRGAMDRYYTQESEKQANKFMVHAINNYFGLIQEYDSKIKTL